MSWLHMAAERGGDPMLGLHLRPDVCPHEVLQCLGAWNFYKTYQDYEVKIMVPLSATSGRVLWMISCSGITLPVSKENTNDFMLCCEVVTLSAIIRFYEQKLNSVLKPLKCFLMN